MTTEARKTPVEIVNEINSLFPSSLWLDFSLFKYERDRLTVCASEDLCYYHSLEIHFKDVSYFQGPTDWHGTPERGLLKIVGGSDSVSDNNQDARPIGFSFINDDDAEITVFASEIAFNTDTVFYYKREHLKPGERIADWVCRK